MVTNRSSSNVRKPHKKHKTHSNKKHDIKIHLEPKYKNFIRMKVYGSGVSETQYSTNLLLQNVYRNNSYPESNYQLHPKFVHVKLNKEDHKIIFQYALRWDCSIKEAANRIFMFCIHKEMGEVSYEGLQ
jgi:hypothetical protein